MRLIKIQLVLLMVGCIAGSCNNTRRISGTTAAANITGLKLLGKYIVPNALQFKNTTVGGLSGIDYDPKANLYYLICDDRSDINPARFYTAKIGITDKGIDTVQFIDVVNLLQADGKAFPSHKKDQGHSTDPEAIRYNPVAQQLLWSSEGERLIKGVDTILQDPAITVIDKRGSYVNQLPLPGILKMQSVEKGPRQNGVLEGMSFADNYKTLFVSVEEPLYQDGARADVIPNDAWIRIFKFNLATKITTAFAYKLDPIAFPAKPETAFEINGVPDILWLGDNKLLVIERSFSTGIQQCTIKVFIADLAGATNINNINSLKNERSFTPASKKLLLNLDELNVYIDNVEGVTFGPTLPNGHHTLIFVADNNFSEKEETQFFLFEIL